MQKRAESRRVSGCPAKGWLAPQGATTYNVRKASKIDFFSCLLVSLGLWGDPCALSFQLNLVNHCGKKGKIERITWSQGERNILLTPCLLFSKFIKVYIKNWLGCICTAYNLVKYGIVLYIEGQLNVC